MTNVELWGERERSERDNLFKSETNSDFVYKDKNESTKHQEKSFSLWNR